MNKTFTLAIAALAVAIPAGLSAQQFEPALTVAHKSSPGSPNALKITSVQKSNAPEYPEEDWEDWGTGKWTDGFVSVLLDDAEPQTFEVQFQKNKKTEGLYRILQPYASFKSKDPSFSYNLMGGSNVILHCENYPYVWLEDFDTGVTCRDGNGNNYGEMLVTSNAAGFILENGMTPQEATVAYPGAFGTNRSGNISFEVMFTYMGEKNPVFLHWFSLEGHDNGYYIANGAGDFKIELPDAKPIDPNADWEACGTGRYTEDVIAYAFGFDMQTFDVKVERNIVTPGLYRLADPYKAFNFNAPNMKFEGNAERYWMIHCEAAPHVWFENYQTGMTLIDEEMGGPMGVASQIGSMCQDYSVKEVLDAFGPDWFGKVDDKGVVTFPATIHDEMMGKDYCAVMLQINEKYYKANQREGFRIEIPGYVGVGTVENSDAISDMRKFDLMGREIAEPAPGTVYIQNGRKYVAR